MSILRMLALSWTNIKLKIIPGFRPQTIEQKDHFFSTEEIAALHHQSFNDSGVALDNISWNDLLLSDYLKKISTGASIFAQQFFYQRLRLGQNKEHFFHQQSRLQSLINDASNLHKLEQECALLRTAETEIATILFDTSTTPQSAGWHRYAWIIPLSAAISAGLSYFNPMTLIATGLIVCFLFHLQIQFHHRVYMWNLSSKSIQILLKTAYKLSLQPCIECEPFRSGQHEIIHIHQQLQRRASSTFLLPEMLAYFDWFQMANILHYFKGMRTIDRYRTNLQSCYLAVAQLEADIKLARHFHSQPRICFATISDEHRVTLNRVVHPLLTDASPLSISLHAKGCFISGQNGVGKSTFLRAIGINLVVGKAFGFCYGDDAKINLSPVYTSIHNEDSLANNESFYIAEMKRAKTLVNAANSNHLGTYLIDEIFRGTNYVESVSAAAAVLKELSQKGLLIVASHHLILANLLEENLTPFYLTRHGEQLNLQPGILSSTNGVQLLAEFEFGYEIENNAKHILAYLNKHMMSISPQSTLTMSNCMVNDICS